MRAFIRSWTQEGKRCTYKVAKDRSTKSRDIETTKYIKDEDGRVLFRHKNIKQRWMEYVSQLFDGVRGP